MIDTWWTTAVGCFVCGPRGKPFGRLRAPFRIGKGPAVLMLPVSSPLCCTAVKTSMSSFSPREFVLFWISVPERFVLCFQLFGILENPSEASWASLWVGMAL